MPCSTIANANALVLEDILAENKGNVIYLDFWASWCVPCRRSFPWMNEINSKYGKKNFKVISINLDSDRKDANRFLKELPANFQVIYDPEATIAEQLALKGMPSSFIFNRTGKLVSTHVGFTADKMAKYEQEIITLLAGSALEKNEK